MTESPKLKIVNEISAWVGTPVDERDPDDYGFYHIFYYGEDGTYKYRYDEVFNLPDIKSMTQYMQDCCYSLYDDGTMWGTKHFITDSGKDELVAVLKLNDAYVEKKKFKDIYPDPILSSKDRKEVNLKGEVFVDKVGTLNIRSSEWSPQSLFLSSNL